MDKPIAFVDVESTGLNPQQDRILQLSVLKLDREFNELGRWDHYIKPSGQYNISESAIEVHGLTKEFIEEHGESLAEIGPSFIEFIEGCDVAGYNSNSFDWKFIYNELQREGIELDMNRIFYDVLSIERRLRPCDLGSVFKRYTGKTMEEAGLSAHNSMSDVMATALIFHEQLKQLSQTEDIKTWPENQLISPEGSIRQSGPMETPILVFTRGKYRDQDIYDVMKSDPSYLKWWSQNVATKISRELARSYCKKRQAADK
jgi:DNA polymerase-3 subunit epsilon